MSEGPPAVVPLGEAAWSVVLGKSVDPALHARVTALASRIREANLSGVIEIVPAYAVVTVFYDPRAADGDQLRTQLLQLAGSLPAEESVAPNKGKLVVIPTRYDGPDLDHVARETGLSKAEVIRRHSSREYRVYLLGFAPGWGYLGELDPALVLPRRGTPRTRVPAGSVAIAGSQTGVYPLATPGGWHILGTTALKMFDPTRAPASLLGVGDRVQFEPVA